MTKMAKFGFSSSKFYVKNNFLSDFFSLMILDYYLIKSIFEVLYLAKMGHFKQSVFGKNMHKV